MSQCTDHDRSLYELLHFVLPRYVRVSSCQDSLLTPSSWCAVKWMPGFIAIPGYVSIKEFLSLHERQMKHSFPMDASSGIPAKVIALSSPDRILDVCCCPGGKLIAVADQVKPSGSVIGVDISSHRLNTCRALVNTYIRCMHDPKSDPVSPPRILLFCADGTDFSSTSCGELLYDSLVAIEDLTVHGGSRKRHNKSSRSRENKRLRSIQRAIETGFPSELDDVQLDSFDAVLVDAQCTHDGSYRHMRYVDSDVSCSRGLPTPTTGDSLAFTRLRKTAVKKHITDSSRPILSDPEGVSPAVSLQRKLIRNGLRRLRPGGTLVYSTCSTDTEQNEGVIRWLLSQESEVEVVPIDWTKWPMNKTCSDGSAESEVSTKEDCDSTHPLLDVVLNSSDTDVLSALERLYGENPESLKALARDVCRHVSSFDMPPFRCGEINGTYYFGRWGGTSGLFVAKLVKK